VILDSLASMHAATAVGKPTIDLGLAARMIASCLDGVTYRPPLVVFTAVCPAHALLQKGLTSWHPHDQSPESIRDPKTASPQASYLRLTIFKGLASFSSTFLTVFWYVKTHSFASTFEFTCF